MNKSLIIVIVVAFLLGLSYLFSGSETPPQNTAPVVIEQAPATTTADTSTSEEPIKTAPIPTKTTETKPTTTTAPAPAIKPVPKTAEQPTPAPAHKTVTVTYQNGAFNPDNLAIQAGDTVRWVNKHTSAIRIASNPHPFHTSFSALDSDNLDPDQTYTFTFTTPASVNYHNHFNPGVQGTVIVE